MGGSGTHIVKCLPGDASNLYCVIYCLSHACNIRYSFDCIVWVLLPTVPTWRAEAFVSLTSLFHYTTTFLLLFACIISLLGKFPSPYDFQTQGKLCPLVVVSDQLNVPSSSLKTLKAFSMFSLYGTRKLIPTR